MKKYFLFIVGFVCCVIILPTTVEALDLGAGLTRSAAERAGYSGNTTETTFAETIGQVIQMALSFVGIIFTSLTVYAGFLWMNARGDESMVEKSKKVLTTAVVGLVITLGSYSITAFILPRIIERTTGDTGDAGLGGPEVACCEVCVIDSRLNRSDACNRKMLFSSDQETDVQACSLECLGNDDKSCDYLGRIPRGQCQ